ncbi:fasciclin domain-containing protein [uncultured Bacteroides sp.]|jgi:uncharacterized surface protein with fasciclin (FAS1) repeats|uniref:fasciclin domain-containing protein n=1 Tax=uncultured Bacteroides sp. TaxID=162156 RepID=UPI00258B337C|nr:fasciclin domain-containing protein [uncultured Bacteroides sp.]
MDKRKVMKRKFNKIRWALVVVAATLVAACNNQWDNHVVVDMPALEGNVLDAVKANGELSGFYALLQETGYDKVLQGAYEYTVLAPADEVLADYVKSLAVDEWTEAAKLEMVRHHIAFGTFNLTAISQPDSRLKMINGKNRQMGEVVFEPEHSDVLCNNGMLHMVNKVVEPLMNIDEYLQRLRELYPEEYEQLDSLYAKTTRTMDTDRSVQKGVNEKGQPVYDTVWTTRNYFFEEMPVNNEDSTYTFVLLRQANFRSIKEKYARYMNQGTVELTDSLVTDELIRDLVFKPGTTTALSGVEVDFSNAVPFEVAGDKEYKASNGTIRFLNGVDIRIKENKVKTVVVEAEDYLDTYAASKTYTRLRTWASGGKDVMVSSRSYQTDPVTKTEYSFTFNTSNMNTDANFYLQYAVKLNSVIYDVYLGSYDDMENHVNQDETSAASTLAVCQKLLASMPGEPALRRPSGSTSSIENNYLGKTCGFAGYSIAGDETYKNTPVHLRKYNLGSYMIPTTPVEEADAYDFEVPRMGQVQLMVCNTAGCHEYSKPDQRGGMMFLDYIKFVPRIADGE